MEGAHVDPFLKEHLQILTKCDISKEDLTASIAYFKGIYVEYSCKRSKNIM